MEAGRQAARTLGSSPRRGRWKAVRSGGLLGRQEAAVPGHGSTTQYSTGMQVDGITTQYSTGMQEDGSRPGGILWGTAHQHSAVGGVLGGQGAPGEDPGESSYGGAVQGPAVGGQGCFQGVGAGSKSFLWGVEVVWACSLCMVHHGKHRVHNRHETHTNGCG
jgi:hypothetical protein